MKVRLTAAAVADLRGLRAHLLKVSGARTACEVLERLGRTVAGLDQLASRGNVPPELSGMTGLGYRELHDRPYRIIYEIAGETVLVHLVADARRDFRTLLEERLLHHRP